MKNRTNIAEELDGFEYLSGIEQFYIRWLIRILWFQQQVKRKVGGNFTIWRIIHAVTVVMLIRFIVHLCAGCDAPYTLAHTFHPMIILEGLALCVFMPRIYQNLPPTKGRLELD